MKHQFIDSADEIDRLNGTKSLLHKFEVIGPLELETK